MISDAALLFDGIAVYQCGPYWRVSYAGTILYVERDRLTALEVGRICAKHFRVMVRVFDS